MQFDILFLFQEGLLQGPGDPGNYSNYTLQILGMLLVAFILGYLLRFVIGAKWKTMAKSLEGEITGYKNKANQFELDLNTCKYEREKLSEEMKKVKNQYSDTLLQLKACQERLGEDMTLGAQEELPESPVISRPIDYAKAFSNDQLQLIEGIGPKIESTLKEKGISNWGEVASRSGDDLSRILTSVSPNFRINDTSTWPQQARLANEGKWEELVSLQKRLGGIKDSDSKAEKMAAKILGITLYKPDDLKVVEGIGPKIEVLLKENGISNWKDLAEAPLDTLKSILSNAGDAYKLAKPDTWAEQAQMAVNGEWKKLEEYQDFLQGGKNPE
jgi:predicted flap endonuclease-1-like 5' DNA nuclease